MVKAPGTDGWGRRAREQAGKEYEDGMPSLGRGGKITRAVPRHNCEENAVPYKSDGALGHGWECGICGKFLQAG